MFKLDRFYFCIIMHCIHYWIGKPNDAPCRVNSVLSPVLWYTPEVTGINRLKKYRVHFTLRYIRNIIITLKIIQYVHKYNFCFLHSIHKTSIQHQHAFSTHFIHKMAVRWRYRVERVLHYKVLHHKKIVFQIIE